MMPYAFLLRSGQKGESLTRRRHDQPAGKVHPEAAVQRGVIREIVATGDGTGRLGVPGMHGQIACDEF
jgi:hypothetical protein